MSQASALQEDLRRAHIEPYAWVINKSLLAAGTRDWLLRLRLLGEQKQIDRVLEVAITRLEIHLSDQNADKSGQDDKRCMMEARLEGRQPIAVTHQAASLDQAVDGAARKFTRLIEGTLGRLHDRPGSQDRRDSA